MKVAVTGATGFVGRALIRALQADGHEAIAVCRSPDRAADLGVEVRVADLRDRPALQAGFQGCDAVIANAALVPGHARPSEQQFLDDNVTGAEHHLLATRDAGVQRLLWISTVAVYQTRLYQLQAEDSPRIDPVHPRWDWNNLTTHPMYARSKAMAERRVWAFSASHQLDLTVVRPGPVYGPGDTKLTQRYARSLCRPIVTGTTVQAPHVYVDDVAGAVTSALTREQSVKRAYNLTGPTCSPYRFLKTWRDALGWRKPVFPVFVPLRVCFDDRAAQRDLRYHPRSVADAMPTLCKAYFDGRGGLR